jgi:hypothetical protein
MKDHGQLIKTACYLITAALMLPALTACAQDTQSSYYGNNNMAVDYKTQRRGGDYTHFRTRDFESCLEACKTDSRCQALDFNITNNACWLKDSVPRGIPSDVIASAVKQAEYGGGSPPYPPDNNNPGSGYGGEEIAGLQITRNVKRNGGDYTNFTVRNMKECARACSRDSRCRSFNFGKRQRDCWLKNSVPQGVPNRTVISGYKRDDNSGGYYPPPANGGGYYPPNQEDTIEGLMITRNVKRNGGDYTNFTVRNMKECARACSRDSRCRSFNYGKQKRDCWLKNNVPRGEPNNTVISGYKKY